MLLFVLSDFLQENCSEGIPDQDLETAAKILSSILEKNPKLQKLVKFKLAPRKILVAEGVGSGWSSLAHTPDNFSDPARAARFAATYQPLIDYLESGGTIVEKEDFYENYDHDVPWESFEEPGQTVLKQYIEDIQTYMGDPEYYHYIGGADNLKVRVVEGPFKIHDTDSGWENLEVLNLEEWL